MFSGVYIDLTNQVPATWFAGDTGIRRLVSRSDGPARGRRHFFPSSPNPTPNPTKRSLSVVGIGAPCPFVNAWRGLRRERSDRELRSVQTSDARLPTRVCVRARANRRQASRRPPSSHSSAWQPSECLASIRVWACPPAGRCHSDGPLTLGSPAARDTPWNYSSNRSERRAARRGAPIWQPCAMLSPLQQGRSRRRPPDRSTSQQPTDLRNQGGTRVRGHRSARGSGRDDRQSPTGRQSGWSP